MYDKQTKQFIRTFDMSEIASS